MMKLKNNKNTKKCEDCSWIHPFPIGKQEYRCELPSEKQRTVKKYIVRLSDNKCKFFKPKKN